MRWREIGTVTCSVARALSVVGDPWTLIIVREAFLGTRRFEDFQVYIGLSPHLLSERLGKLVKHGVMKRRLYCERPARHEYRLTRKGRDLYPVIVSLARWGDDWLAGDDGPPLAFIHRGCGRPTVPVLACSECGDPITPFAVRAEQGPAMTAERASQRGAA
jgi:DNA-binding HxlR family transcriptional regulator